MIWAIKIVAWRSPNSERLKQWNIKDVIAVTSALLISIIMGSCRRHGLLLIQWHVSFTCGRYLGPSQREQRLGDWVFDESIYCPPQRSICTRLHLIDCCLCACGGYSNTRECFVYLCFFVFVFALISIIYYAYHDSISISPWSTSILSTISSMSVVATTTCCWHAATSAVAVTFAAVVLHGVLVGAHVATVATVYQTNVMCVVATSVIIFLLMHPTA